MGSTWDHPQLGSFKFVDGAWWTTTVDVPAFKAFAYDTGFRNAPRSTGKHRLAFQAYEETDLPSPQAIKLASKVLANQAKLVAIVTHALWDDFNGRGPGSSMWWHGDLAQVAEMTGEDQPPTGPDDLLALMQVSQITVRKDVEGHDEPLVELSFHAAFDDEHGVSVLTDGETVLGMGSWGEITPFQADQEDDESAGDADFVPPPSEELVDAILTGDEAKAKKLVAAGMDINALSPDEIPPLWIAVDQMQPTLVRRLLGYGADPKLPNPDERSTPLQHARGRYRELGFAPTKKKSPAMEALEELAQTLPGNPMAEMKTKLEEIIALLEAASGK